MKHSIFAQIELCKTCEFWEPEDAGWCYMFEDMPEYKCMAWEARE